MPLELAQAVAATRRAELLSQLEVVLRNQPSKLTLEIGCGHGHYLAAYAATHPDEFCLGIDIIRDRLERAEKKTRRAKLPNVAFLLTEARMLVENLPKNHVLEHIFVLFPDPWPKRRHNKHRLIRPDFLDLLATKSAPGARLYFRTDHGPYFEEAAGFFQASSRWNLVNEPWPFEQPTVFQNRALDYQSSVVALTDQA
jgi:tRNA (guanine-N7-)-methyltransferase|uniref:tRNA (guanosine(46)-N7)-methyltransferase TrmB n=1 Tax=Cephaloticoccus sp. TaxID=1985742 RepID=UPI00404A6262